jgi:hypothetical protein
MPSKVFNIRTTLAVGLAAAALSISPGSMAATVADGHQYAKPHRVYHQHALYKTRRWAAERQAETLPGGPEYDFLTRVPANAIRMPGYTYVPGVGILGESCDLPTSACPNQYRDIQ